VPAERVESDHINYNLIDSNIVNSSPYWQSIVHWLGITKERSVIILSSNILK